MIEIRPGVEADAGAVADIYVRCWRDQYAGLIPDRVLLGMTAEGQTPSWRASIRSAGGVMVAADDGRVVGFGSCGATRFPDLPFAGEIYTLYLLPEDRGAGTGWRLLRGLFSGLVASGRRSALVWVLARNPARFFYAAVGGRLAAERTETLWKTPLPQVAFGWPDLTAALATSAHRSAR